MAIIVCGYGYVIIYLFIKDTLVYILMGSDSNLLIVFYVQIMPDDLVMQLHRF